MNKDYDYLFKILMIGNSGHGIFPSKINILFL